jgi:hypothetical protein
LRWLLFHPGDESLKFRVCQQSLDGRILTRQLGFSQQRVHLAVAHAMQELCLTPAFALGNEVVRVALRRWNFALAQGANHDIVWPRIHGISPDRLRAADSDEAKSCLAPDLQDTIRSAQHATDDSRRLKAMLPEGREHSIQGARIAGHQQAATGLRISQEGLVFTGKADRQRLVLGGFGTADSHQMINCLNWGFGGE